MATYRRPTSPRRPVNNTPIWVSREHWVDFLLQHSVSLLPLNDRRKPDGHAERCMVTAIDTAFVGTHVSEIKLADNITST